MIVVLNTNSDRIGCLKIEIQSNSKRAFLSKLPVDDRIVEQQLTKEIGKQGLHVEFLQVRSRPSNLKLPSTEKGLKTAREPLSVVVKEKDKNMQQVGRVVLFLVFHKNTS